MITGVPNHSQLNETAVGWLNLAWEITIDEVMTFHEVEGAAQEIEESLSIEKSDAAIRKFQQAAQYKLNNAISLLQQSLELFLKARIAETSPFLLISGDPQTWPRPDKDGNVEFANFRTLDAVQLCRAVSTVSASPLPDAFVQFYDRLRKVRNRIAHLSAGILRAEAKTIIVDILTAHAYLFPPQRWVEFRKRYLASTGAYSDDDIIFDGEDHSHDRLTEEIAAAFDELSPQEVKKFFHYDAHKRGYRCPKCLELRTSGSDREWPFAQKRKDGHIECVACMTAYTVAEYKEAIQEFFGYLDKNERQEIAKELEEDFPERKKKLAT